MAVTSSKKWILLITFLSIILLIHSYSIGQTHTKIVAIQGDNAPLRSLLQEMTKQSQTYFVFEDKVVDGKYISCHLPQTSLNSALSDISMKAGLAYEIIDPSTVVLFAAKPKKLVRKETPSISELLPPILKYNLEPDYPQSAKNSGLEGSVKLKLLISKKGEVKRAQIIQSSGHKILDKAALEFVKKYKFYPASEGGNPIEVWLPWVLNYQLVDHLSRSARYVKSVLELSEKADYLTGYSKNQILQQILDLHVDYAQTYNTSNCNETNKNIQYIISPQIYQTWSQFEMKWPLYFLVFHDFIIRNQNFDEIDYARSNLIHFVKKELSNIQNLKNDRFKIEKEYFLKYVHTFLENTYPQAFKDQFHEEVISLPY